MIRIHLNLSSYQGVTLNLGRSVLDNFYNLAFDISGYDYITGIIMPAVQKSDI
jgi:hypothetical protein